MRILVTGASGMCGNAIANHLFNVGHEVVGLYKSHVPNGEFTKEYCDLSEVIALDGDFDVIVHCAGALPYQKPSITKYVSGNIDSMRNLLDFAHRKGIERMIYISTIGIYGEFQEERIDETSPRINPDDYGQTKYVAERMLADDEAVKGISLRCPGIVGKGARGVWLSKVAEKMLKNEHVSVSTPEFITKNLVHTSDLSRFIETLVNKSEWENESLVIACDEGKKVIDIIEQMKKELGSSSSIIEVESNKKPFCLDSHRAVSEGYCPMKINELIGRYCSEIGE